MSYVSIKGRSLPFWAIELLLTLGDVVAAVGSLPDCLLPCWSAFNLKY